jgi:hypothetical protein
VAAKWATDGGVSGGGAVTWQLNGLQMCSVR